MRNMIVPGMFVVAVAAVVAAAPAEAQDVIKDPAIIGSCLCERQALDSLFAAMDRRRRSYDSNRQAVAALDRELALRRRQINADDKTQIEAFTQLLKQRDAAAAALADATAPDYNAAVGRYNAESPLYNTRCSGKSFDQTIYNRVEAALSCPKP